jgi:GNAT superfamily N-acetyltransferase
MYHVRRVTVREDWPRAAAVLREHLEWIRAATDFDPLVAQPAFAVELDRLADHYAAPDAMLFLAARGDRVAGTVAVRCHRDGTAELKRMYVRPPDRGRGVAGALVTAVLDAAADRGCNVVWLETIRGPMDPAIAVYHRHGFVEVADRRPTLDVNGVVVMERALADLRRCA